MEEYYTITMAGKSHQKWDNFWMKMKIHCIITCLAETTSGVPISSLHFLFLKNNLFIYYFIFGFTGSLLLCVGSLYLWPAGPLLLAVAGFSPRWLPLLWSTGSRCTGFSSGSTQAQRAWCVLPGMWNLPRPGVEPVSPGLAGRFVSTVLPGKSQPTWFILELLVLS